MGPETLELENSVHSGDNQAALEAVDRALVKSPKNVGFFKQKAALILRGGVSRYSARDAEKCLLRAHQLAPLSLDILNDLVRLYGTELPDPEKRSYFYDLFCSTVDHKLGLSESSSF